MAFIDSDNPHLSRLARGLGHSKGSRIKSVKNAPLKGDGQDGDMQIKNGNLYIKDKNIWHHFVAADSDGTVLSTEAPDIKHTATGYEVLDSGLIIQWGIVTTDSTVTFPIAFPTECLSVVLGKITGDNSIPRVTAIAAANFTYSSSTTADGDAYWQAIGH
jgi:hypothetical protein